MGSLDPQHMPLGPLDHLPPRHYTRFVLYLPLKRGISPTTAFNNLHLGLHKTFLQLPWLNGKVHWQTSATPGWRPGQLELRHRSVNIDGPMPGQLKYNDLGSSISYAQLKASGFPPDAFRDDEVLWAPFEPDLEEGAYVFVGQANFIPGGCLLSASVFHSAADGMAEVAIFKLWGDSCRDLGPIADGRGLETIVLPPENADRRILDQVWAEQASNKSIERINPTRWELLGLEAPNVDVNNSSKGTAQAMSTAAASQALKSHVFYIPPARFTQLKRDCMQGPGNSQVSGNDAVCALIWRCLSKARLATRKTEEGEFASAHARLEMTLDGRPYLSLPPTYLGNVVLISQSSLPLLTLTAAETSVATVAQTIRHKANSIDTAGVLDAYALAKNMPDFRRFDLRVNPIGGWKMLITSLLAMPAANESFGDRFFGNGGKPEAIRPLMGEFNKCLRICFVMPPKSHGGVEVVFGLFDEELDYLVNDEEFTKYAMIIS